MKRIFWPLMGALLFAGCSKPDPRVAAQQVQIEALTKQVSNLQADMAEAKKEQQQDADAIVPLWDYTHTNTVWMSKQIIDSMLDIERDRADIMNITNYLGIRYMRATYFPPPRNVDPATGLPR